MTGLKQVLLAAALLLAAVSAYHSSGVEVTPIGLPPVSFADTETCAHVAVPPLEGRHFLKVSMALSASPSNSLSAAFGADADGDGRLSLREQAVELGWDSGAWFVRRGGASARGHGVDGSAELVAGTDGVTLKLK